MKKFLKCKTCMNHRVRSTCLSTNARFYPSLWGVPSQVGWISWDTPSRTQMFVLVFRRTLVLFCEMSIQKTENNSWSFHQLFEFLIHFILKAANMFVSVPNITSRFSEAHPSSPKLLDFHAVFEKTWPNNWHLLWGRVPSVGNLGSATLNYYKRFKLCDIEFLAVAQQNVPIKSILTDFTPGSWKDFDVGLSLIGSKEMI